MMVKCVILMIRLHIMVINMISWWMMIKVTLTVSMVFMVNQDNLKPEVEQFLMMVL